MAHPKSCSMRLLAREQQTMAQPKSCSLASFLLHPCSIKKVLVVNNNANNNGSMFYQCNDQFMDVILAPGDEEDESLLSSSESTCVEETPSMRAASSPAYASPNQSVIDVSRMVMMYIHPVHMWLNLTVLLSYRQPRWAGRRSASCAWPRGGTGSSASGPRPCWWWTLFSRRGKRGERFWHPSTFRPGMYCIPS